MYSYHLIMVCVIPGLFIPYSMTGSLLRFLQIRIILISAEIKSGFVCHRLIDWQNTDKQNANKQNINYFLGTSNNCLFPLWSQIEAGVGKNRGFYLSLALSATDFEDLGL